MTIKPHEKQAWKLNSNQYLAVQTIDTGYDYTIFNSKYQIVDGGQLDNPDFSMEQAKLAILSMFNLGNTVIEDFDYDTLVLNLAP